MLVFYPWVMYILTIRITEAFGLPKLSLFSKYKVMLLLCHHRVNWIQIQVMWYLSSCWLVVNNHVILLHKFFFLWELNLCRQLPIVYGHVNYETIWFFCLVQVQWEWTEAIIPISKECSSIRYIKKKVVINRGKAELQITVLGDVWFI